MNNWHDRQNQLHAALKIPTRAVVGILVFMTAHRRVFNGKSGRLPKPLVDDALSMNGYDIDAPEEIPAGGCFRDVFGPDTDDWGPAQLTVSREVGP